MATTLTTATIIPIITIMTAITTMMIDITKTASVKLEIRPATKIYDEYSRNLSPTSTNHLKVYENATLNQARPRCRNVLACWCVGPFTSLSCISWIQEIQLGSFDSHRPHHIVGFDATFCLASRDFHPFSRDFQFV